MILWTGILCFFLVLSTTLIYENMNYDLMHHHHLCLSFLFPRWPKKSV